MNLQVAVPAEPTFLAVEPISGMVHIVPLESPFARAACNLAPRPQWDRVWQEPVNRLSRPLGLCRSCWHANKK